MLSRVASLLVVGLVGIVVLGGLAFYLRTDPRFGTEPSESPAASVTSAPTDSAAPSESPSESPTESLTLTPTPEPTVSPTVGSLEEFVASIAAPVVAEIDGKPEWVIARHGSIERVAPMDDVTFTFYRNGLNFVAQPRGEDRSNVRLLDPAGQEVASFDVPAVGPSGNVYVTPDRRLAYVVDSSIFRVDLWTGGVETLYEGPHVFRGESSLSPSGNTLASPICPEVEDPQAVDDTHTCRTQLITGTSIVTVDNFAVTGTTDEYLIGTGSGIARQWLVYSIQDGESHEIPVPIRIAWDGYAMEDGRFVITGSDDERSWSMWVFDPVTGSVSPVVLRDVSPGNYVIFEFAPSARWAVVGDKGGLSLGVRLDVIDLETGHTVAEVVLGR